MKPKEPIDKENPNLYFYNVKKHQIVIWVLIIVTFIIAVFGIPWVIGGIEWVFGRIPLWQTSETAKNFNIGVLPDFLGGMVGILAGFFMEWCLFSQLKTLSKYKAFLTSLNIELRNIYVLLSGNRIYEPIIKITVLDDIILIADNNAVFYSLPKFPNRKRGEIFKLLSDIYGYINNYNLTNQNLLQAQKNQCETEEKLYKSKLNENKELIKKNIEYFFKVTGGNLKTEVKQ